VGRLKMRIFGGEPLWLESPLWLGVDACFPPTFQELVFLQFFPAGDVIPVVEAAKPRRLLITGSAYRSRFSIRARLFYVSLREAEEAVERLEKAGMLTEITQNLRKRFVSYVARLAKKGRLYPDYLSRLNLPPEDRGRVIARVILEGACSATRRW